jgi:hypothetical protein
MKSIGLLVAGMILCSITISHAFDTVHVYINGSVDSVNGTIITIDGSQYVIDAKCRVVIMNKENDIFHENPARTSDIRIGDRVTAKKIAGTLYEIIIERWKQ